MRIAQIAPLFEAVPPTTYGGTERVIAALCDGLVDRGHDVTLFAAGSSSTRARLVPCAAAPLRERLSRREMIELAPHLHLRMLAEVYERSDEFDIIHSHTDIWTLPFSRFGRVPVVVTMHGRLDLDHVQQTMSLYPDAPLVSISDHQREVVADLPLNWVGRVYNGLDLRHFARTNVPRQSHLAFVGRISAEKGPDLAVEVARRTGRCLQVAAKIDPLDLEYYGHTIEPLFRSNNVHFLGELSEAGKPGFFASAAATLFPSDWPEPFGLVMIESLAAGTPVIALRRGSVPEILVDGVTGFICDGIDDMVEAVRHVEHIDPEACRRRAASFDAATMSAAYEQVYAALVGGSAGALVSQRALGD